MIIGTSMNIRVLPRNISEGKLVALAVTVSLAGLVLFFVLISGGIVRHVPYYVSYRNSLN
jgi:hypothetical protein